MNAIIKAALFSLLLVPASHVLAVDLPRVKTEADFDRMLGVYYCITERMAGIQQSNGRYVGPITPDAKTQKFTLKISKTTHPLVLDKGEQPWYSQCRKISGASKYFQWMSCDALYKAESPDNYSIGFMMGDTPEIFHGDPAGELFINDDLTFRFFQISAGSQYVSEGHCSRFENK